MKKFLEGYFSVVKRFVPEPVTKSTVGLDIGSDSCKLVEVKVKGNSHEIINWACEPLKGTDVKQALQNALTKFPQAPSNIVTSVSGKGTLVRYIDLPKMTYDDLKRSFSLEADKYFPFPKEQIYTDCFILDKNEKDNKMAVMVAAAKKEVVDQRIELLKDLGLQTEHIVLDSIAVSNVINVLGVNIDPGQEPSNEPHSNSTAILDIGKKVSTLSILAHNLPRFSRDVFIGGHDLTCAISNGMGITLEEAEALKRNPKEKSKEVLQATDSVIMNLVSELRLSFDYFITEKNIAVGNLLLTGGGSTLDGLPELFSKYLEMPVIKWNPLASENLIPAEAASDIEKNIDFLTVALGLALYR